MTKSELEADIQSQQKFIRNQALNLARTKLKLVDIEQSIQNLIKSKDAIHQEASTIKHELEVETEHLGALLLRLDTHDYDSA